MTTDDSGRRVSHDLLMRAQEALGEARDAEREAGHKGVSMVLNDMALNVFQVALSTEVDALADAAFAQRYPEAR